MKYKVYRLVMFALVFMMTAAALQISVVQTISADSPPEINPNTWYRLTNSFLGEARVLDTYSGTTNEPFMGETGNYSGQFWKFTPTENGYYRLTNMFLGEGRALDTYGDTHEPFIAETGDYSGQFWKITPAGGGYYRLTNMFLGEGRSLDTYSDTHEPFMDETGNYSGQFWKITPIRPIENVPAPVELSGTYRIQVVANGRYLHEDGGGDQLVSTRYQPDDDFTRFMLEPQSDGSYRIQVVANGRYLHEDGWGDQLVSTRYQPNDDFTRFMLEPQSDGSYRIKVKASGRYLHEDGWGDQLVSTRYQPEDDFTKFRFVDSIESPTRPTSDDIEPMPRDEDDQTNETVNALPDDFLDCPDGVCYISFPPAISGQDMAAIVFEVRRENITESPDSGGAYQLTSVVKIKTPIGETTLELARANLVMELDETGLGGFERVHGQAEFDTGSLRVTDSIFEDDKLQVDIALDRGRNLTEFDVPVLPERHYLILRVVQDQEFISVEGSSAQYNGGVSIKTRFLNMIMIDPLDPALYMAVEDPLQGGIAMGISRNGWIPFEPDQTYGIGQYLTEFSGHEYLGRSEMGLPPLPLEVDGDVVSEYAIVRDLDDLSFDSLYNRLSAVAPEQTQFDAIKTVGLNGTLSISLPIPHDVKIEVDGQNQLDLTLGNGSAVASYRHDKDEVSLVFSGQMKPTVPFEGFWSIRPTVVASTYGTVDSRISSGDIDDYFVVGEGEFALSSGDVATELLGNELNPLTMIGKLTAVPTSEHFVGMVQAGHQIHPDIGATGEVQIEVFNDHTNPRKSFIILSGELSLFGEDLGRSQIRIDAGGLHEVRDKAVAELEAEISRLDREIETLRQTLQDQRDQDVQRIRDARAAVQAEQDKIDQLDQEIVRLQQTIQADRDRDLAQLQEVRNEVSIAQQEVDKLQTKIDNTGKRIDQINGEIAAKKRWLDSKSLFDKVWAGPEYAAFVSAKRAEQAALYTKIAGLEVAKKAASGTLAGAKATLKEIENTVDALPVDADPRLIKLFAERETAVTALNAAESFLKDLERSINLVSIENDPHLVSLVTARDSAQAALDALN